VAGGGVMRDVVRSIPRQARQYDLVGTAASWVLGLLATISSTRAAPRRVSIAP